MIENKCVYFYPLQMNTAVDHSGLSAYVAWNSRSSDAKGISSPREALWGGGGLVFRDRQELVDFVVKEFSKY